MSTTIIGALTFIIAGCTKANGEPNSPKGSEAKKRGPSTPPHSPRQHWPAPACGHHGRRTTKKLFLDVHELGKGKVTAKAVADAHKKDLATEGKYGVDYKAYWVDEKEGKIYCLAEAPSADAAKTVHKEAHGLVANKIMEVTSDNTNWVPTPGKKLYMDVHHLGAGKVTAKDVAGAHQKDLAVKPARGQIPQLLARRGSGTVMCLSEAPNAEAAIAVHREAHGLIPTQSKKSPRGDKRNSSRRTSGERWARACGCLGGMA